MKTTLALFGAFCVVVVLCMLILNGKVAKTSAENDVVTTCTGNAVCVKAVASIVGKNGRHTANQPTVIPSGYCLQVPVLMYHHIQPEADALAKGQKSLSVDNTIFESQMAYLASHGYTSISAEQLVDAILTHGQVPVKSVVVTFDDGYLDNFLYAFPVLQKYHLIGNLMVPTGLLGVNAGANTYFTWDQLKQMVSTGMIFAYNHTWSHYPLAQGPREKDVEEITTAQSQLKQFLGKTSPILVYPYGSGQTLGWLHQLLHDNGFVAGFSTMYGRMQCEGNIYTLPRIHIGNAPLSSYGI